MSDIPPLERIITIEPRQGGWWRVRVGDRYADGLTWDEMLGQIAYMTCLRCKTDESLFRMKTKEEWDAYWASFSPKAKELKPHEKLLTEGIQRKET